MTVPTQCYAAFSRAFNPQVLLSATHRSPATKAIAMSTTVAASHVLAHRHTLGCTCCHGRDRGRSYSSVAPHGKSCACPSCGSILAKHSPGCGCGGCALSAARMSTLTAAAAARGSGRSDAYVSPHPKGCGCPACSILKHGSSCACGSCRSFATAALSHPYGCSCTTCGINCSANTSIAAVLGHGIGCACMSCVVAGRAPSSSRRSYSSAMAATVQQHPHPGCACASCCSTGCLHAAGCSCNSCAAP